MHYLSIILLVIIYLLINSMEKDVQNLCIIYTIGRNMK